MSQETIPSLPGLMSLTITVPDSVPSLFHSSLPWVPSSALKNSVSPTAISSVGRLEPPGLGLMSLTSTVPDSVPSLLYSSMVPSDAEFEAKKTVPPTAVVL